MMAFCVTLCIVLVYSAPGTTHIIPSTDEPTVRSTTTRGNMSTIPSKTEGVAFPSEFPVTTSRTTTSTTNTNTDTSGISKFLSEFPQPVENTTVLVTNTVADQAVTTSTDHTVVILSVGLVLALITIIFIGVGLIKMRANNVRKTARRLPSIPKKGEHPYEFNLHYPKDSDYFDPDYQTVEEINDGYQHLIGYTKDIGDDSGMNCDDRGSYVQPNEVHVGATITDEDENDKHHSYLQILECPEKMPFTNNECTNITELASTKCDNEMTTEQERTRASVVSREVSDINQQETATLATDNNHKEHCDNENL